jgi:surface antigen
MKRFYKFCRITLSAAMLLTVGCAGGGMSGLGASGYSPMGSIEGAVLNSVVQNMAGSVLNGQIGAQASPSDQSFRLQQLGGLLQSGAVHQPQQWVNPQTGNTLAMNPVGQQTVNPQTQQQCRNLQETLTLQNGQSVQENRVACLDPQTGKWNLVQ